MLEGIGLDAGQERIYLALLAAPAQDAAELAARTGLPEERVAAALAALLAAGLAEDGAGAPEAVRAAPPEVAPDPAGGGAPGARVPRRCGCRGVGGGGGGGAAGRRAVRAAPA
ncbi:helix-turn-helix domain-containing protein [Streptomyces koyangensis]